MAWLLRLPKVLQVPIALALIVGACFALAFFAVSLPLILLYLWIRRTLAERSAFRALVHLSGLQGTASTNLLGQVARQVEQLAAQPGEGPPSAAGSQSTGGVDSGTTAADSLG